MEIVSTRSHVIIPVSCPFNCTQFPSIIHHIPLSISEFVTKQANKCIAIAKLNKDNVLRIPAKLLLQTAPREDMSARVPTIDLFFPNRPTPKSRKIGFKFAGCSPLQVKQRNKSVVNQVLVQSEEAVEQFNSRIVICRRKLLKQLVINDVNDASKFVDYRRMNI